MRATITIRQGTRNHDVKLGKERLPYREQKTAVQAVRALVKAGVVTNVEHITVK